MHSSERQPSRRPSGHVVGDANQHQRSTNRSTNSPSVLFVGNLSFFCEESHLHTLFDEYCYVQNVRIHRNESKSKSLQFGFITVSSSGEAKKMEAMLNNHWFMGRKLRVSFTPPDKRQSDIHDSHGGVQVHVSFCSFFAPEDIVLPKESFLRKVLLDHGKIIDVCVKEYRQYDDKNMQEGYAFITMATMEDAQQLCARFSSVQLQGFTLSCSLTRATAAAANSTPAPQSQPPIVENVVSSSPAIPQQVAYPYGNGTYPATPLPQPMYQQPPYPYYGYGSGHPVSTNSGPPPQFLVPHQPHLQQGPLPMQMPMYMMPMQRDTQPVYIPYSMGTIPGSIPQYQNQSTSVPTLSIPQQDPTITNNNDEYNTR